MSEPFTGPRTPFQEFLCECAEELFEDARSSDYKEGVCQLISLLVCHTPEAADEVAEYFGVGID